MEVRQIERDLEVDLRRRPGTPADLQCLADLARQADDVEVTRVIRTTPAADGAILFRVLPKARALDIFENLSAGDQADLIGALRSEETAHLIEELDPDDRALLFDELPASVADRLMRGLDPAERRMTTAVLGYPRDSIGRYMSPEVLPIPVDVTAAEALERVRARIDVPETIYLLPVVDTTRRLRGVIGLRRLLAADGNEPVSELMKPAVAARAVAPREETARRFLAEKLLAMPIVDDEERLVGLVTIDDAIEIIDREDEMDIARSGGSEPLQRSYLAAPIFTIVRSRIVWLVVLAISAILTVQVLEVYENRLDQVVVLALFIPLLTGTGGNTGNQAATTVTRALAIGDVRVRDLPRVIGRELRVGFCLGAVLGTLGLIVAGAVYGIGIGLVIGLTLVSICSMAACVGGVMPLVAKMVGADPAVFSNPFISTFCDASGLIIYFTIATAVLGLS